MLLLIGASLGAVALPVASSLYAALLEPHVWRDGQFIFLVIAAVPIGGILGVVTALAVAQQREGDARAGRQVAVAGSVVGIILGYAATLSVAILYSLGLAFWAVTTWPPKRRHW